MCGKMTNDFQDVFVLDVEQDSQPAGSVIPLEARWNLESREEDSEIPNIAINLGGMVIKLESSRNDPFDME